MNTSVVGILHVYVINLRIISWHARIAQSMSEQVKLCLLLYYRMENV